MSVKRVIAFSTGWTPPTGEQRFYDGDHLWANISDLGPRVLAETQKTISDEAVRESRMKASPPGSLLFAFKLSVGAVSITRASMYTNEAIATFLPEAGIDVAYLYWAAPVYVSQNAIENIYGAQLLNRERIANARLGIPPAEEQRAIASFLDCETAKIDALVAKKERVIELLQEKRAALITQAVTRGLDPNVPMKASGVEWLGEIPAHWETWRLKHVSGGLTVGVVVNPSHYVSPSGVPFLRGTDVTEGRIVLKNVQYMTEEANQEHHKSTLRQGDLVSIRVGYPGVTAVVPAELEGSNCASLLITRRSGRVNSRLLCYLMNSAGGKAQFKMLQDGAAQEQINVSDAVDFLVPLPPNTEQEAIVAHLDGLTSRIDALLTAIREGIDRLREFRTALISAAVTGKIDVREGAA